MSGRNNSSLPQQFTFIDLFAGIGGFRLGLERLGGQCLNFSEINNEAIKTYCDNFDENPSLNLGDITKIKNLPDHDLLTAGVPCQSWSIAGKNLGFDDDRGQLWNDTVYLLNKSRPKAFIFENVKGLTDPRNMKAFAYILERIRKAGYHAKSYILNSYDYGVLQNRVRVYIVGFREEKYLLRFKIPPFEAHNQKLKDIIEGVSSGNEEKPKFESKDIFGNSIPGGRTRFQKHDELNDFFLFNDIRNGHTTVHSWDLLDTTIKEKEICYILLRNRRKSQYGPLDGNPLSLQHFKNLDGSIAQQDLDSLVSKGILKRIEYSFSINDFEPSMLTKDEMAVLEHAVGSELKTEILKTSRRLKLERISFARTVESLKNKGVIAPLEIRYDFKHSKISSGINGVNRIYLPTSAVFSTLVASDSNDYIALTDIPANSPEKFKMNFIEQIYKTNSYRKITKEEACVIQGFPKEFKLPQTRNKWMKLIGNSVSVPVIENLGRAIIETGIFDVAVEKEGGLSVEECDGGYFRQEAKK